MLQIIGLVVCFTFALWILQKQRLLNRVRYNGQYIFLSGTWYIFPFYLFAYMTAFPESNSVCTFTILLLFSLYCTVLKPFKSFCRNYNIWYVLLIFWYVVNLWRADNIIYGINQIVKLFLPVVVFLFAYKSYRERNSILYLFDCFSKSTWFFLFLCILSLVFGMSLIYSYYGMEVFVFPFILYLMNKNKKYLVNMILCLSFCLIYIKRTCFIGIFAMLATFFIYKYKSKSIIPTIFLIIISISAIFFIPSISQRLFYSTFDISTLDLSLFYTGEVFEYIDTSGRNNMWTYILESLFKNNEICGIGPGSLKSWMSSSTTNDNFESFQRVHNDWLQILIEGGYVAVFLLASMFVGLFVKSFRIYNNANNSLFLRNMALFTAMTGIATAIHMFFENCMGCVGFCLPALSSAILFRTVELEKKCK